MNVETACIKTHDGDDDGEEDDNFAMVLATAIMRTTMMFVQ